MERPSSHTDGEVEKYIGKLFPLAPNMTDAEKEELATWIFTLVDAKREDLMEAAMCAWEHVLEQLRKPGHNKWRARQRREGMAALRHHVSLLSFPVDQAYRQAHEKGYGDPFDWDFVPEFLERATDESCELRVDWSRVLDRIVSP